MAGATSIAARATAQCDPAPDRAGLLFARDLTAGFRATYRFLIDDPLAPALGSPGGLFDASLTLGGRF
jgi:hypothetical protein